MTARRHRLTRRRTVTLVAAAAALVFVGVVLGPWALAVVVALVGTTGLVAGWAAVEARVFAPTRPPTTPVAWDRTSSPGDHVAFARALTAVATAYLAECERQEHQR